MGNFWKLLLTNGKTGLEGRSALWRQTKELKVTESDSSESISCTHNGFDLHIRRDGSWRADPYRDSIERWNESDMVSDNPHAQDSTARKNNFVNDSFWNKRLSMAYAVKAVRNYLFTSH